MTDPKENSLPEGETTGSNSGLASSTESSLNSVKGSGSVGLETKSSSLLPLILDGVVAATTVTFMILMLQHTLPFLK